MTESRSAVDLTLETFLDDGVVLCIRLGTGAPLLDACRAALAGGLRILEVTLTTPGALEAIRVMSGVDGALTGGGTVLTPEAVREVASAGGRFVLSPVFDPAVLEEAHRLGLLAVPGAASPTEILAAHRGGARLVKVFPSGALGGPAYLNAVRGPLPHVPLLPTSGPTAATLGEFMDAGSSAVGVGNEVFPPGYTLEGIETACRRIRSAMDTWRDR